MNWRRWVGGVAVGAVIAGPVLLGTSMAGATTGTYTDPRPCSASVNQGICISTVTADFTTSSLILSIVVGKATDPTTDPDWTSSMFSVAGWDIAESGSSTPSLTAFVESDYPGSPGYQGFVAANPSGSLVCGAADGVTATFNTAENTYGISIPATCLQSPSSVTVDGSWSYDTSGGTSLAGILTYESPETPADQPPVLCCMASPDTTSTSSTTTSTALSTTTTTTSAPQTTTTTRAVTVTSSPTSGAAGGATASSGQLAYTGAGTGLRVTAVLGAALLVLGVMTLGLADGPRRALRRLVRGSSSNEG